MNINNKLDYFFESIIAEKILVLILLKLIKMI